MEEILIWMAQQRLILVQALILKSLDYLLNLRLAFCSVHYNHIVFSNPTVSQLHKGLLHIEPVRAILMLVLLNLMKPLLELLSECPYTTSLTLKPVFLAAVTLARRVSKY